MKTLWLNLPVKDLNRSKQFFRAIGFRENPIHQKAEHLGSFLIGEEDFVLMLFPERVFVQWLKNEVTDTKESNEILINIDAQSQHEVEALAKKIEKAGGTIYDAPHWFEGWMYLCSFTDPDGHCWNILYMDMDKMPKWEFYNPILMNVNPYLNFDGNAEEAFRFYQSVFGGEFISHMKMSDAPDADKLPAAEKNRTMHISLPIGSNTILMASDILPAAGHKFNAGNNSYISLHPESRAEADRLFNGLSEGGEIEMPMEDQFWGDYFGCFTDKFGILWMVNYNPE